MNDAAQSSTASEDAPKRRPGFQKETLYSLELARKLRRDVISVALSPVKGSKACFPSIF
jgi:hypothetical protein